MAQVDISTRALRKNSEIRPKLAKERSFSKQRKSPLERKFQRAALECGLGLLLNPGRGFTVRL